MLRNLVIMSHEHLESARANFRSFKLRLCCERNHVLRFAVAHQLRHAVTVNRVYVRVRLQNQFAAVPVSLPLGDHLHVHAFLDGASDEHAAE